MSRPSITTDASAPVRRCSSTSARRTPGMRRDLGGGVGDLGRRGWQPSHPRRSEARFRHPAANSMCGMRARVAPAVHVVELDARPQGPQRHGPIHRAGIDIDEAEPRRRWRARWCSCPRRPVRRWRRSRAATSTAALSGPIVPVHLPFFHHEPYLAEWSRRSSADCPRPR